MSKFYYPEEIIGSKFENNNTHYLVQWKGYKDPTWEPSKNVAHRTDLITAYRDMLIIQQLGMQSGGYIYCRVSSKEQSNYIEGRTSLLVQEQEIRKFCTKNDIRVIDVVIEVYSARNMDKMSGLKHLCNIISPGQKIYVYDISRFSRNTHHALNILEELNNRQISVVSVTENISYDSPTGRNQFRLQLCASNYFSDMCSQKVKASIIFRKERGDYIGSTPFGFTTEVDEKTHVRSKIQSPDEMKIIETIRKMDKNHSSRAIVTALLNDGIKFRNKDPTIASIMRIQKRFLTDLKSVEKVLKTRKYTNKRNTPY